MTRAKKNANGAAGPARHEAAPSCAIAFVTVQGRAQHVRPLHAGESARDFWNVWIPNMAVGGRFVWRRGDEAFSVYRRELNAFEGIVEARGVRGRVWTVPHGRGAVDLLLASLEPDLWGLEPRSES